MIWFSGTDNRDAELCEASRKRLFQVLHVGQASLEGSAMGSNSSELIAQRPNGEKRLLMSVFVAQHPCFYNLYICIVWKSQNKMHWVSRYPLLNLLHCSTQIELASLLFLKAGLFPGICLGFLPAVAGAGLPSLLCSFATTFNYMIAGWGQKHADNFRLTTRQLYIFRYGALLSLNSSEKNCSQWFNIFVHTRPNPPKPSWMNDRTHSATACNINFFWLAFHNETKRKTILHAKRFTCSRCFVHWNPPKRCRTPMARMTITTSLLHIHTYPPSFGCDSPTDA